LYRYDEVERNNGSIGGGLGGGRGFCRALNGRVPGTLTVKWRLVRLADDGGENGRGGKQGWGKTSASVPMPR
jgi:hypothetical protein